MPGSVNQELSYFLWPKGCRLNQRKGREIKSDHRVQKNFTKLHFFFLTWENEEERREQCRNTLLMMALSSKSMVKKWLAKKKKKRKKILYIYFISIVTFPMSLAPRSLERGKSCFSLRGWFLISKLTICELGVGSNRWRKGELLLIKI